jgi:NADH-quinone oxidoreductase subunit K
MLQVYGIAGALLFATGIALVATRRNAVMALIGIELIFNAANINLVAFAPFDPSGEGYTASLFVMALAAAEAAVALALILNVFKRFRTVDLQRLRELKG